MNCYVTNPYSNSVLPDDINKDNALFYPESGMTTYQLHTTSRPRDYHIITDSHFLINLYSRHEVFMWDGLKWVNPDYQTYGASYGLILKLVFGIKSSIPLAVLDGNVTNCMGNSLN